MTGEIKHGPDELLREAAGLFYLLGGVGSQHLAIVGGLVPPLLVPDAADAHVGSADLDFCLSVAITEGATREYYLSTEEMIGKYFEPARSGFRWRKQAGVGGLPILIDFLAPAAEEDATTADGTRELAEETAAANAGIRLRPFPIRSGGLIDQDAETRVLEGVEIVYETDLRADVMVRFAGPVGFLAAKADALDGRRDSKDGYDVSWWTLNAQPTPAEVAELVIARPAFRNDLFPESVHELQTAFQGPDYPGPHGYAKEKHPSLDANDEQYNLARNEAYSAVSALLEVLRKNLWPQDARPGR
jgi:hypothetical protein